MGFTQGVAKGTGYLPACLPDHHPMTIGGKSYMPHFCGMADTAFFHRFRLESLRASVRNFQPPSFSPQSRSLHSPHPLPRSRQGISRKCELISSGLPITGWGYRLPSNPLLPSAVRDSMQVRSHGCRYSLAIQSPTKGGGLAKIPIFPRLLFP